MSSVRREWTCHKCTLLNSDARKSCMVCRARRCDAAATPKRSRSSIVAPGESPAAISQVPTEADNFPSAPEAPPTPPDSTPVPPSATCNADHCGTPARLDQCHSDEACRLLSASATVSGTAEPSFLFVKASGRSVAVSSAALARAKALLGEAVSPVDDLTPAGVGNGTLHKDITKVQPSRGSGAPSAGASSSGAPLAGAPSTMGTQAFVRQSANGRRFLPPRGLPQTAQSAGVASRQLYAALPRATVVPPAAQVVTPSTKHHNLRVPTEIDDVAFMTRNPQGQFAALLMFTKKAPSVALADAADVCHSAVTLLQSELLNRDVVLGGGELVARLLSSLKSDFGVTLATIRWTTHHICAILSKLTKPVLLSRLLSELAWRHSVEVTEGVRSCLQLVYSRDAASTGSMTLCVVGRSTDRGLLLTDGWYFIWASLDTTLSDAVQSGEIFEGVKLLISGCELRAPEDGSATPYAMDMHQTNVTLALRSNGTQVASPSAPMGFVDGYVALATEPPPQCIRTLPTVRPRQIALQGGVVPCLKVVVVKSLGTCYVERFSDNGKDRRMFRNIVAENRHADFCVGAQDGTGVARDVVPCTSFLACDVNHVAGPDDYVIVQAWGRRASDPSDSEALRRASCSRSLILAVFGLQPSAFQRRSPPLAHVKILQPKGGTLLLAAIGSTDTLPPIRDEQQEISSVAENPQNVTVNDFLGDFVAKVVKAGAEWWLVDAGRNTGNVALLHEVKSVSKHFTLPKTVSEGTTVRCENVCYIGRSDAASGVIVHLALSEHSIVTAVPADVAAWRDVSAAALERNYRFALDNHITNGSAATLDVEVAHQALLTELPLANDQPTPGHKGGAGLLRVVGVVVPASCCVVSSGITVCRPFQRTAPAGALLRDPELVANSNLAFDVSYISDARDVLGPRSFLRQAEFPSDSSLFHALPSPLSISTAVTSDATCELHVLRAVVIHRWAESAISTSKVVADANAENPSHDAHQALCRFWPRVLATSTVVTGTVWNDVKQSVANAAVEAGSRQDSQDTAEIQAHATQHALRRELVLQTSTDDFVDILWWHETEWNLVEDTIQQLGRQAWVFSIDPPSARNHTSVVRDVFSIDVLHPSHLH